MANIELTEDDLLILQRCINERMEPSQELAKKLFPSLYTSFDFKALKDSKIPTIEYQGKRSEAAILNEASLFGGGSPLQLERCFDGGKLNKYATQLSLFSVGEKEPDDNWQNLIVQGDNLQFLKTCFLNQDPIIKDKVKGKVKLFYSDPPFATKSDFGGKDGERSYSDKVATAEFIEGLRERLIYQRELLDEDGSIYVHLDQKMSHYVKVMMDEVFGKDKFRNEIIWHYRRWSGNPKSFQKMHDTLFWYSKDSDYVFNRIMQDYANEDWIEDTVRGMVDGKLVRLKDEKGNYIKREKENVGVLAHDVWEDINFIAPTASERLDYPTQKPEALLERIILASSNPGDLVMDIFGGSGTTAAVAEKLGRRWITCDFGKHAIYTIQKRICEIAKSQKLALKDKKKKVKYDKPPKPFSIVSVGAFDFGKIMNLRQNRDAYISFVLGIFGITERDDRLAVKYRVSNVCALKDNNPVEVFPVWDDDYLNNVRVDEEYLQDIITQSGGKFKGIYYLVAPENCVRIGETELKNTNNDKVIFKILSFPYKVLEEVSRNFSIEEQPNTPDNINKLVSSVGFYFNEEVSVNICKSKKGLLISNFETSIPDSAGKRCKGLAGLAMLLIDTNYKEEDGFTVDAVVYAKDMKGEDVHVKGVSKNTAVIAIDRHGNESPITLLTGE